MVGPYHGNRLIPRRATTALKCPRGFPGCPGPKTLARFPDVPGWGILTGWRPRYAVLSVGCSDGWRFGRKLVRLRATSPLRSATRRVRRSLLKWMVIMAKRLPNEHEAIKGAGAATATAAGLLSGADLLAGVGGYGVRGPWRYSRWRSR